MRGAAIIEIVLVTSLVGLMGLLILNWPNSFSLNQNSQYQTLAKQIASQKIEDLRLQTYANLANGETQIQDQRLQNLPSSAATLTISDCPPVLCTNQENIKQISIVITWLEKGSTQSVAFNTLIAEGGLK